MLHVKRASKKPKERVAEVLVQVDVDGCIRNVGGAVIASESQLVDFVVFDSSGLKLLQGWDCSNTVSGGQQYGPITVDAAQYWVLVNRCLAMYRADCASPIVEEEGNWWDVPGTGGPQTRCFRRVTGPKTTNIGEYYGLLKNTSGGLLKNRVMRWTHPTAGWFVYTRSNNDGYYFAALPGNANPYTVDIAGPDNLASSLRVAQQSPFLVQKTASPQYQDMVRT
jgi:hypothetical protein